MAGSKSDRRNERAGSSALPATSAHVDACCARRCGSRPASRRAGLGGATFNLDFLHINTAAFTGSGEATFVPKAFSGTVIGAGNYTIGASGEVTITFVDLTGTFLAGRGAGSIFVIDQLLWDGQLSPDQKTLLVSATEPVVQTETASKASRTSASATARGSG